MSTKKKQYQTLHEILNDIEAGDLLNPTLVMMRTLQSVGEMALNYTNHDNFVGRLARDLQELRTRAEAKLMKAPPA